MISIQIAQLSLSNLIPLNHLHHKTVSISRQPFGRQSLGNMMKVDNALCCESSWTFTDSIRVRISSGHCRGQSIEQLLQSALQSELRLEEKKLTFRNKHTETKAIGRNMLTANKLHFLVTHI